jgi:2'-5' RNA ligase
VRLFVALDVNEEVRGRVQKIVDRLERRLAVAERGSRRPSPVRWVSADRLHLTLRFIGEVADPLAAEIEARLAPPFAIAPFEIALAGVGVFPPAGGPRVVWIGLAGGADRVRDVQEETVRRLHDLRLPADDRPFSAHLTLGRFRETGARYRRRLEEVGRVDAGRCTIDHVTLYQSRLSPKGPTYVPRLRTALAASDPNGPAVRSLQGGH